MNLLMMKQMMHTPGVLLPWLLLVVSLSACDESRPDGPPEDLPRIIFDTDLGNSNDDALAMQALFDFQQQGRCQVIGVMTSLQTDKGRDLADRFLHYYRADDVPLGILPGEEELFEMVPYFNMVDLLKADGSPLFPPTGTPLSERQPAYKLYRRLLAEAEDGSVVIVCVGKYSNLGQLLRSPADEYSPLSGEELVRQKVRCLEVMGGCFTPIALQSLEPDGEQEFLTVEYNIAGDIPMAKKVLESWPTELHLLPIEEGMKYPSNHDEMLRDYSWQPDSPLFQIYSRYDEWAVGEVGQYWWDALVALHAVMGEEAFACTESGYLTIADDGHTTFAVGEGGRVHVILSGAEQVKSLSAQLKALSLFRP